MSVPLVLTDAHIVLNSTNISTFADEVSLDVKVDELDSTTFGGGGWHSRVGGLKDFTVKLGFVDDFTASTGLDAVLWPLFGTVVTCNVKGTSASNSTANPEYQGSVLVSQLTPVGGNVGDLAKQSVTWPGSGTLTRATT